VDCIDCTTPSDSRAPNDHYEMSEKSSRILYDLMLWKYFIFRRRLQLGQEFVKDKISFVTLCKNKLCQFFVYFFSYWTYEKEIKCKDLSRRNGRCCLTFLLWSIKKFKFQFLNRHLFLWGTRRMPLTIWRLMIDIVLTIIPCWTFLSFIILSRETKR
jgi:hypothetical protein